MWEKMPDHISVFLNLLRFLLWPNIWSILENVPYLLEKNMFVVLWGGMFCVNLLSSSDLMCHLKSVFLYWFSVWMMKWIFFFFIFISWRLITLQYCSGFCHTLTWISHGFTCIPHKNMEHASRICMSSLRRGHANLLCIVPIFVYVLPKQTQSGFSVSYCIAVFFTL